eukprot:CAMPEP_0172507868 /NCGR_PEP_ID=MMETSP1066-20121228/207161_1 /TAXON_ID=671091 /ORGANISM="Coscinodiscus wailesii, Strain CCMP2513" /LENGTH=296 /DNA_ID=CAMNT_0013285577 /DNA_START=48 /DNA_END=938 /DNA_ORIENTATION=-
MISPVGGFSWGRIISSSIYKNKNLLTSAFFSTGKVNDIVTTEVDEKDAVATMVFNRPPVNSLSLEMCQTISQNLKHIENNHPHIQSLLLKSSNPNIFSAGIAIEELHNPDPHRLAQFWTSFQQLFIDLYTSRLAVIAVIQGHAIAGGCLIAMCADYRVMISKKTATIGLSETKLGISAPLWMADLMVRTVGTREAEKGLCLGLLYVPGQAMGIGLVDEVVEEKKMEERAREVAMMWTGIPPEARVKSKMDCRMRYVEDLERSRKDDLDSFCEFVLREGVQRNLGLYIEKLKTKKAS